MAPERLAVQLSQNLFAEITGVILSPSGKCEGQAERRLHCRIPFDQRARIFPLMEGVAENGTAVLVRDISVGGIGFLCAEQVGIGDEFIIRLPTTIDQPVDIQCAVRRCEMGGTCGSQFAIGATFELVLNRSLSLSIAPESEMAINADPIVDQPAPPTIEQRYDQQCAVSRLIRPIIRETRWDKWMAKPAVKKVRLALTRIFWPALLMWRMINVVMQAGEGSRIRNRLTPAKSRRKSRAKKRELAAHPLPPQAAAAPTAQADPAIDVALMKTLHPALFREMGPSDIAAARQSMPAEIGSAHRPIFAANDVPPSELPVVLFPSPVQVVLPVLAEPYSGAEPIAEVRTPTNEADILEPIQAGESDIEAQRFATADPNPAIESVAPLAPTPALEVVERLVPDEPPVPEPVNPAAAEGSSHLHETAGLPEAPKVRPPVSHPRQMRRRARPMYHR